MKLYLKQRYENEAFETLLVKPTTKFEKDVLKILKGDLIVGKYGEFHPELLGEKLCRKYAAALDYPVDKMEFISNDWMSWWEDDPEFPGYRYFNEIPSNVEVIEAALKMAGRYRKLARFRKEMKRLEKVRMFRHKRVEHELFWDGIEEKAV
nr:MAG TPA: hypothetical protein [Caudoviricetes sp.]